MMPLRDCVQSGRVLTVAHRGSSGTSPENTIAAIEDAIAAGADMIELDIQRTADDAVVVFHDSTLDRTTDGSGALRAYSYSDLQNLSAGAWFDPQFAAERIPLLRSALERIKGRAYINIEIKPPPEEENYIDRARLTSDIIRDAGMLPYTLFSSFHHDSIVYLKSLTPEHHAAAIQVPGDDRLPSEIAAATKCDAFVCALEEHTPERARDAADHGIYTGLYTINTPEQLQTALELQATAIVTNFPDRIRTAYQALTR